MSSDSPESSPAPPPPSDSDSSPPPETSTSPPPPDSSSSSSPPPPDSSSSSPPPPSQDNSSPPPPSEKDNSGSPPPPNDDSSQPPPPPPPPPPPSNDEGEGSNQSRSPPAPRSSHENSPAPPRSGSHSHRGSSPSLTDSSGRNDSSEQTAIIAGAAAGAGLLLIIMILLMVCCTRSKKKKSSKDFKYYQDNNSGNMNNYYNNGGQGYYHNGAPSDHIVKMHPPPGSAGVSSEHTWPIAPPPPPPAMSSGNFSSAGFSGPAPPPPYPAMALGFNQSNFTYEDLSAATDGFSRSNLLGQGGFGYVHKGVLPNGKEVAVKSLKLNSGQGDREFQAEVDIISRVHHRYLVSLVGYCSTGTQRMLVYEFVPNGTLEYHLHGEGRPTMDWATRLKIALGSAKGFSYLHEDCHPRIIHRDIKAANILLDMNFDAMVADFGLAKLSQDNNTHVSTRIMGTFGYLAPEYASSGKLTDKSDVYSFGVMLLELITGRRPVDVNSDDDSLVDWARPILVEATEGGGNYEELVDPRLGNEYDPHEMRRMVVCAAACIRHSARRRPKMSQIVRALEGDVSSDDLNATVKGNSSVYSSSIGSEMDLKRLAKAAGLSSQDFSTSSDEGHTGEFSRNHQ